VAESKSIQSRVLESKILFNMSTPTQAQASQNALLPPIPELFGPDFLNKLVTRGDSAPVVQGSPAGPSSAPVVANPMMDALRAESARTYTQNGANAYDSTLSPTLDAFNNLTNYTYGSQVGAYLGAVSHLSNVLKLANIHTSLGVGRESRFDAPNHLESAKYTRRQVGK
jgi:uncharacterized protein (DUF2342 family)